MTLASGSKSELLWWIKNLHHSHRSLVISKPDLVLTTDASLLGWGAVFDKQETGGQWSSVENKFHINYLEMKAILLGLQSLCNNAHNTHICVQSDNTTAVSYINAMGGVKSENCHDMALQIWEWCITKQIWSSPVTSQGHTMFKLTQLLESLRILLISGLYQQRFFSPFSLGGAPFILTCLHQDLTIK